MYWSGVEVTVLLFVWSVRMLVYRPTSESMPARRQARVHDCTRVRLTPMLAAAPISPPIKA